MISLRFKRVIKSFFMTARASVMFLSCQKNTESVIKIRYQKGLLLFVSYNAVN